MRILVAYDGSPGAAIAADLVRSIDWPAGSAIRLLTVIADAPAEESLARMAPRMRELTEAAQAGATADLDRLARSLRGRDWIVDQALAHGRPATAIEDEVARFGAELVVLGSRGHDPIVRLILGSVAGEVAERAACPVLIARAGTVEPIVFATDGSASAREAERILAEMPIFAGAAVDVISVADLAFAYHGSGESVHALRLEMRARRIADQATRRLKKAGLNARSVVRRGDPAAHIVVAAEARTAGLIVVGSRGRMGFKGALLGSVARNVLHSSASSVLVVRSAIEAAPDQPTQDGEPAPNDAPRAPSGRIQR